MRRCQTSLFELIGSGDCRGRPTIRKNRVALVPAFPQHPSMLARVLSAAVNGIEAYPVEVEVNSGRGDTKIVIVGLPDAAVKESRNRVTTALTNSGFKFHTGRCTINLAPADVGIFDQSCDEEFDMAEVKGQESVKRALEIAAAGGHNALLIGPP